MFVRESTQNPRGGGRTGFRLGPYIAITVGILVMVAMGAAVWTEFLWFGSMELSAVWVKRWSTAIALGAGGAVFAFLVVAGNLQVANRISWRFAIPRFDDDELTARARVWLESRGPWVAVAGGVVGAIFIGVSAGAWRDDVFLFLERRAMGTTDPIFGMDVGFYIFQLPIIDLVLGFLFGLFALTLVIVAVSYFVSGSLRIDLAERSATTERGPKIHLSILLAVLALLRAAMYRIESLELLYATRQDEFYGPGFTDINARIPALNLLIGIAVVAAVLFTVNIWRNGWTLPAVVIGSWVVLTLGAQVIYPAVIERIQVIPQQLTREAEYIEHNIAATRAAWGIDQVDVRDFPAGSELTMADLEENSLTIDNLRLWDTTVLPATYQNFQELRPYYTLESVDTDRYVLDGQLTQVMIAAREVDQRTLPQQNWVNNRLIYTHGFGAVMSQANAVESDGQPQFLLRDVPARATHEELELSQERVYFGETYFEDQPVIVRTGSAPQEVDYPLPQQGVENNQYGGEGGVVLDSWLRRLGFAVRYRDLNLLISGQIRDDSRVIVERNINEIVSKTAPFLDVDSDPYPVILDGRIIWVVDMYTASSHYPYSKEVDFGMRERLSRSSTITQGTNYMRNSVKATVDAFNGDVRFYLVDSSDPLAAAWADTFPDLFTPASEIPEGLEGHFRYPQDLFRIQSALYLDYHMLEPSAFFTGNDEWEFPIDPADIERGTGGAELLVGDQTAADGFQYRDELLPYYLLTRLPGEEEESYVLLQPFNPRDKPNMAAFLVADSTPGKYGRMVEFRMPQGEVVDGTNQVDQRIDQNDEISEQFTLWSQQGSRVVRGDMLVVPIEESVVYVQPVYLRGEQGGFPEFRRVVIVYEDQVEWANTLDDALNLVFGEGEQGAEPAQEAEAPPTTEPSEPGGPTATQLLNQAETAFEESEAALREGDLATYQSKIAEAKDLVQRAVDLLTTPDA